MTIPGRRGHARGTKNALKNYRPVPGSGLLVPEPLADELRREAERQPLIEEGPIGSLRTDPRWWKRVRIASKVLVALVAVVVLAVLVLWEPPSPPNRPVRKPVALSPWERYHDPGGNPCNDLPSDLASLCRRDLYSDNYQPGEDSWDEGPNGGRFGTGYP